MDRITANLALDDLIESERVRINAEIVEEAKLNWTGTGCLNHYILDYWRAKWQIINWTN